MNRRVPSPKLTNVVLSQDDLVPVRALLERLAEETSADGAMLLLRSGEVAVSHLEGPLGQLDGLGALLAGNFGSAREIARLLGDVGLESQLLQGASRHVFIHAVGDGWLLAVVFASATSLGLVRVLASRAAAELVPLHAAAMERSMNTPPAGDSFRKAAASAIDAVFRDRS